MTLFREGRRRTEEILRLLQTKVGIDVKMITLENEKTNTLYNQYDEYNFKKKFYFQYKANNSITESVVALLENMSDIEYEIDFKLNNKSEKEQLVMSSAVNNSKEKAEKLATALGSCITGFEEIKYRFNEKLSDSDDVDEIYRCFDDSAPKSIAAELKNPKIQISKSVEIIWTTD